MIRSCPYVETSLNRAPMHSQWVTVRDSPAAPGPKSKPTVQSTDEKVAVAFVGDHAAMSRVVRDRVADVRTFDVPVVMEEDTSDLETRGARHFDVADEPVAGEVDEIRELDGDSQGRVLQRDVGDQRILHV